MTKDIEDKEKTLVELTHAREFLEKTVQRRKMFHDFLSTVVENEASRGRYVYFFHFLSNLMTKDTEDKEKTLVELKHAKEFLEKVFKDRKCLMAF